MAFPLKLQKRHSRRTFCRDSEGRRGLSELWSHQLIFWGCLDLSAWRGRTRGKVSGIGNSVWIVQRKVVNYEFMIYLFLWHAIRNFLSGMNQLSFIITFRVSNAHFRNLINLLNLFISGLIMNFVENPTNDNFFEFWHILQMVFLFVLEL